MLRRRPGRLKALPVNSLIPNILTVLALCAGMTAIRFGLEQRWELAAYAIVIAGILDGLDGRMARLLKGATKFGAELDSLSDFIAFGVAPAIILYLWSVNTLGGLGWVAALAFATACALRLARFNTALEVETDEPAWSKDFFTGVAAPAGACFALLPLVISFQIGPGYLDHPIFTGAWLLFIAYLMISRIPTYSFKLLRIRRDYVLATLVVVGLGAAVAVSYPYFTYSIVVLAYLVSIPFSFMAHRRLAAEAGDDSATKAEPQPGRKKK